MEKTKEKLKIKRNLVICIALCAAIIGLSVFSVVRINSLSSQVERLNGQVSSMNKKADGLNKNNSALRSDLDATREELEAALAQIEADEEEIKKYRALINTLQELNEEQEAMIETLQMPLNGRDEKTPEPADTKIAYLTFDDGPSDRTDEILKILTEKEAVATFFVINTKQIDKVGDIIKQGSAVAMHSDSHSYQKIYASANAYFEDLHAIEARIYEKAGVKPKILRMPGGSSNTISKKYAKGVVTEITQRLKAEGYVYFDWNVDSTDASGDNVPAATLLQKVQSAAAGKQVVNILMHDSQTKTTTVEALPQIIDWLRAEGYQFMTLSTTSTVIQHSVNN